MENIDNIEATEGKLKAREIERIKYIERWFDPRASYVYQRTVYELCRDGRIVVKKFLGTDRKCVDCFQIDALNNYYFNVLCGDIDECIETANTCVCYTDDCNAEVHIYRAFGRKEIMTRGFGTETLTIGDLITRYIMHAEESGEITGIIS